MAGLDLKLNTMLTALPTADGWSVKVKGELWVSDNACTPSCHEDFKNHLAVMLISVHLTVYCIICLSVLHVS